MKKINKDIILNLSIVIISFLATYFLKYVINFEEEITYTNSIVSLIVFVSFIYLLKKTFIRENIEKIKSACFLGIMFSTFLVIGNSIDTNSTVEYGNIQVYLAIIFISFMIDALLVQLYKLIEKFEKRKNKEKISKLSTNKKQLIAFLIIVVCWIPVFLAAYPGYFCYDAYDEFKGYAFEGITTWHSVIHNILLGAIITNIGNALHDINIGIAVYTISQMLIVAGCFTYCISFLEKYNTSKIIKIISILYYALFPVIAMFAICSTKDTIFSALAVVSVILAIEALLDKEKFLNSKWNQIKFAIIIFLAIIFRNNAIYAYIPFLIIFTIAMKNKKILISIVSLIILYLIYIQIIYNVLQVSRTYNSEAFSVPLQQIARVYNYNYESLTKEELDTIYEYTTDKQLKEYLPECSDRIKNLVYLGNMGYGKFFRLWFEIGLKNPGMYIDSFLENTLGFWYPDTIIDGYNKKAPKLYGEETSYFAAMCEPPGEEDSKIPWLRDIYYNISRYTDINKIPVISMLFSLGAMAWGLFICIGYNIYKKRKEIVISLSIIFFLWLTVLLGPMVLVRYVLILFFGFPLILAFTLNGANFTNNKE